MILKISNPNEGTQFIQLLVVSVSRACQNLHEYVVKIGLHFKPNYFLANKLKIGGNDSIGKEKDKRSKKN